MPTEEKPCTLRDGLILGLLQEMKRVGYILLCWRAGEVSGMNKTGQKDMENSTGRTDTEMKSKEEKEKQKTYSSILIIFYSK